MNPTCVGIIMDGNRRWAKGKGLPKLEGHRAGVKTLKEAARFARDRGVKHLALYAFSTENWNREPVEVSYLLDLFRETIQNEVEELRKEGIQTRFVGQKERFSTDMRQAMDAVEKENPETHALTLWICLSYGGRAEILAAAQAAANEGEITESSLARHLWTAQMPEPDLIIRTGGEKRLSNFLTWQSIYSELFFTDTFWPDFSKEEFGSILEEFAQRERRRGK